jgi:TonB family protein
MTRTVALPIALTLILTACATRRSAPASDAVVEAPKLISCPSYPLAKEKERGQYVALEYTVRTDGRVDPASIRTRPLGTVSSSRQFESAARTAAASCVYQPGARNGEPTAMTVSKVFVFDFDPEKRVGKS